MMDQIFKAQKDLALQKLYEMRHESPYAEAYYELAKKLIQQEELREQTAMFAAFAHEERWRTDPLQIQQKIFDPILYFDWRNVTDDLAEFLRKVANWLENL